ncbi:MAG: DUF1501 domain-containing protein [Acidobacteriota bacterium]
MTLQTAFDGNRDRPDCLVVVFLRGAADGLELVPPTGDDDYYRARPTLGIRRSDALPLDGLFGLNPILEDLAPAFADGELAIVHAAGSEDSTRSHFDAQDLMEHGGLVAGGWLGRFLRYRPQPASGALSAIAVGKALPECLRGAPSATVMQTLEDFTLGSEAEILLPELARLYASEHGELGRAARDTLQAMSRIEALRTETYTPGGGAEYPRGEFGEGLLQIARLIKARVGLEAVSIDLGGWDSHLAQETLLEPLMRRLARGLAAFRRDLGPMMATTTVVVMTEFGRRVQENASLGTDHGRGSVMFVLGGGVAGGRVVGTWPGLEDASLEGPGDLPVAHNYRNVLAPILKRHGAGNDLSQIFPDYPLAPMALY